MYQKEVCKITFILDSDCLNFLENCICQNGYFFKMLSLCIDLQTCESSAKNHLSTQVAFVVQYSVVTRIIELVNYSHDRNVDLHILGIAILFH